MDQSRDEDLTPGVVVRLAQGLRRIVAPNPSPMTAQGTNTYLVGDRTIAVIDPGPASDAHLDALRQAIGNAIVSHIILTHSHLDHSPLAAPLAARTGAQVYAFGPSDAGRSVVMQRLAADGLAGGGEGIDPDFAPNVRVADGDQINGDGWTLGVMHTPGHMGNHICLTLDDAIFTGDLVMGWASSLVSPPDGDLTDFMASITRLQNHPARVFYPGHGAPIIDPAGRLAWLRDHRLSREAQIIAAIGPGTLSVDQLTAAIYADVPQHLLPAASRNVFAHLIDLHTRGRVLAHPHLSTSAQFTLAAALPA